MIREFAVALGFTVAFAPSCRSRSGDDGRGAPRTELDAGAFDKASLLRAFAECSFANYKAFATTAAKLDTAVSAAEANSDQRVAAQDAWKEAMSVWQRAEVFQFGPTAMTGSPGARDMRDPVYAWPLVSRCLIDQTLHDRVYETPDFANLSLVSTRTLAALEYLLFYEEIDNGCAAEDRINAQGSWAMLGATEIKKRRLAYAHVVASDVLSRALRILDLWDPSKDNFVGACATAPNATFPSQQMAFNAVSDAMFYLDDQVKNMKVGVPAGLVPGCAAPPCLDAVESPWAKRSKEHVKANLAGYEQLLKGCNLSSDLGFDDLLSALGAAHVTQKLDASLSAARFALDELHEPTFEEDIQKNPSGVRKLFDALRENGTLMKSEFVTVLDLEIPRRVEGDND